jgi:Rieske Fe-S protein
MAKTVGRRQVIAGGGLVAVGGVLVACGGGGSSTEETAAAQPSPSETEAATAEEAEVAEEIAEEEVQQDQGDALVSVSEVPVEGGVVFPDPAVVVVQPAAGDIKCFSAVCPHQGCLVASVEANEILCPCHGSLFSAQDGSVIQGPARQGLPPVDIAVEGDSVILG